MCELLERARQNQGNISYYEVAKRLKISSPLMTKWKNNISQPNGYNTLRLADMAGLDVKEALKLVQGGFISMSLLIMTGSFSMLAIAELMIRKVCILCKIVIIKVKAQLRIIKRQDLNYFVA